MYLRHIMLIMSITVLAVSCFTQKPTTLKDAFKNKFLIGTAINKRQLMGKDSLTINLAIKQFNSVTPENMLKWQSVHPKPGIYNFGPSDTLIAFAEENNMLVIGHTLVWHSQTPEWVFQNSDGTPVSKDTLMQRMKDHIFEVVGRYKGKILGWDVVNEAFVDDGTLRKSKWLDILGEDFIENAFKWAHEADPDAELYYNDFNMYLESKRNSVVKMVKDFKAKGVPIHGIGLQGHWGMNYPENNELEESFKAYAATGLKVMITEMDLDMLPSPGNYRGADISKNFDLKKELDPWPDGLPDSMQTIIADRYAEFFNIFNEYSESISRVTLWGVHDGQSWRNYWPIRGRTAYPLLFDRKYQPKKAFYAVIKTVKKN